MKKLLLIQTFFLLGLFFYSLPTWSQGSESFDNLNASGSTYTAEEISFTGDNSAEWHHRGTRLIGETSADAINGITCGLGSSTNDGYPGYVKTTITGGLGELSFNWRSYFTSGDETDRSIKILINGTEVSEFTLSAMGIIESEMITINAPGNVLLEFLVSGTKHIAIDDIAWTSYTTTDPLLTTFPLMLSDFTYMEGEGPSESQSYVLSGFSLEPESGDITVSATENFEVSSDNINFAQNAIVSYTNGEFIDVPIYVRLKNSLVAGNYSEVITNSGGSATNVTVDVSGTVDAPMPELTIDGYTENFTTFLSAETFPPGWEPDDVYNYEGDFGSGSAGGLRGNGVLGFQLTGTAPNNEFKTTLTLINNTGQTIEDLDVEYLGKVARETQDGTPKWIVSVDGTEVPELEYSTASGVDELVSHIVTGLNIPDGNTFTIEWFTTSAETSGTRRQIGVTDVNVSLPVEEQVANPVFNPAEGTYLETFDLEITTATEGATVFYKFAEADPWTEYTAALTINASTNVWAYATKVDLLDSEIVMAEYIIPEGNIESVELFSDVEVAVGTIFEELPLPASINATLDDVDQTVVELDIIWQEGDYDGTVTGTYNLIGDIVLVGSITNTENIKAEINVIVTEEVIEYAIISVEEFEDITVDYGTTFGELVLPENAVVTLENSETESLIVDWAEGDYDGLTAGTYNLIGTLQLVEGIINPDNYTASINVIVLEEVIPEEEVIAGWTFPVAEDFGADLGIDVNIGNEISRENEFAGAYTFPVGASTQSISTASWNTGIDTKYWIIEFSTINYKDLNLSSAQRSSNTGPRDFKVQYKIGEGEWIDIIGSEITVDNNFTSGVLNEIVLPEEMNNKASVLLRWTMTSNTAVDGADVAGSGTSRIDDILIKGMYDFDFIRTVAGVDELQSISAEQGTPFIDLNLPATVRVYFEDLGSEVLNINWLEGDYDPNTLGNQVIFGELILEDNMDNPDAVMAEITVVVLEEILDITAVETLDPITVYPGIAFNDINLPEQVEVTLSDASTMMLDVEWLEGTYNPEELGSYLIQGDIILQTGILNPEGYMAEIEVIVTEPEVVVGWTFPIEENIEANLGIISNIGNLIAREPDYTGTFTFHDGVTDYSVGSASWADGMDTKFWQVEFSTMGYKDLVVSSAQFSTPAGPRDFKIQYRIGTDAWEDVANTDITVGYNFTQGVITRVELPDLMQNKLSVSLRWIMTSNVSQSGGEVTSGRSQIDDILIEGTFSEDFKRIVTGVEELEDIEVEVFTTVFEDLPLPETVEVFFDDGGSEELAVIWNEGNYDGDIIDTYVLEGDIVIDDNMENPDGIKATINVIVREPIVYYTVIFNVDMSSHPSFDPDIDVVYIRGDMNNWGVPGTDDPNQLMTQTDNPYLFTKTFELEEGTYEYKYYKNAGTGNPEGGDDRSIAITEDIEITDVWSTTNIHELNLDAISIYPNPAEIFINIASDKMITKIELTNIQGRIINSYSPDSKDFRIDLSGINNGVYLLVIYTHEQNYFKKIIINN